MGTDEKEFHSANQLFPLKQKLVKHTRISSRRSFSPWVRVMVQKASFLGLTMSRAQASEEL